MKRRVYGKWRRGLVAAVCGLAVLLAAAAVPERAKAEAAGGATETDAAEAAGGAEMEMTGAVNSTSEDGITVTLATDKTSYRAGEEIHYTIRVENGRTLWDIKGTEFTYSNTEGLVAAAEDSRPYVLPDIAAGESVTLSGTLVGDEEICGGRRRTWHCTVNQKEEGKGYGGTFAGGLPARGGVSRTGGGRRGDYPASLCKI